MVLGQRRRDAYTARGVTDVNTVLEQISKGDLTVTAAEDNSVTSGIAQGLNKATQRQCQVIRDIRITPTLPRSPRMAAKDNADLPKDDADEGDISLDMSQAAVKRMIAYARERGYITYDQLNSVLPPDQV